MFEEIIKILKQYHDKKQYADDKFILDIIDIIATYRDIKDYVEGILIIKNKNEHGSRYYFTDGTLAINASKLDYQEDYQLLHENHYGIFNLLVLETIIHELEHAYQGKLIDDDNDLSVEKQLLLLSDPYTYIGKVSNNFLLVRNKYIEHLIKKYRKYYNKYYYKSPFERMAILRSCCEVLNICEEDFIKDSPYYSLYNRRTNNTIDDLFNEIYEVRGELTNSPSLEYLYYLNKKNQKIILTNPDFYNPNMPTYDRAYYGLALTKNEFENTDEIKKALIKIL